jgi:hypothetical protein
MQEPQPSNRILSTILVVALAILSALPVIDRQAGADYDALFQRALVTFALARTLNGVISVVQGTELAIQPAGVGVTLTPGQILDPVNDLVERFSWVMLGATLSLGVQNVLLEISSWWGTRLIVALLAIGWLLLRHFRRQPEARTDQILLRAFLLLLFLRFAVPLSLIANDARRTGCRRRGRGGFLRHHRPLTQQPGCQSEVRTHERQRLQGHRTPD